jgi:hypothetical protein
MSKRGPRLPYAAREFLVHCAAYRLSYPQAQKEFESSQYPFCGTTMCTRCPLYFTSTVSQCVSIYTNLRELHHDDLLAKSPELFV